MNSAEANVAFVTPALVKWARIRSGLSYAQIQNELGVSEQQIVAWEQGDAHPPFDKAQKLAELLRVPFGYLFLSESPRDIIPIKDFRLLPDSYRPSTDFLSLLNDVLVKQDWYRDFLEEEGDRPLSFVGAFSVRDDPKTVAANIRSTLHLSPSVRMSSYSWNDYIRSLARHADEARIMVMRSSVVGNDTNRKLSKREFQGFAISDPLAPVIFVNSDDFVTAQIFTFAHELAHIWIGQSAVSNPDPSDIEAPTGTALSTAPIEQFCNQVAIEVLVPRFEFTELWKRSRDKETMLDELARHFWVSNLVILRRAYELQKIDRSEFFDLRARLLGKQRPKQKVKARYYRNIPARMSRRLTRAVLADLQAGRILYRDAAGLLSLRVPTLEQFARIHK